MNLFLGNRIHKRRAFNNIFPRVKCEISNLTSYVGTINYNGVGDELCGRVSTNCRHMLKIDDLLANDYQIIFIL